ncbi:MAG: uroporphyrinogen decarboxylase family protein [Clostridia bacterium]|nr:uroporphyrinogen decarboxylase family protein [Clostridia bacterium]
MKRNMKQWVADVIASPVKAAIPVLSFPVIQKMDITVEDLIRSAEAQSDGMALLASTLPTGASVSLMDLSVEAECFGSQIKTFAGEVPAVVGAVVTDEDEADALEVPEVGTARTGIYIDAIAKAVEKITDRPVFAGVIGPFSLAGRLMDVSEIMYTIYDEPETVHKVLDKVTDFLIAYIRAYKAVGANGVLMAEPLAGLINAEQSREFSCDYVRRIVDAVQDDEFVVIYHNCGISADRMVSALVDTGCVGFHFGNASNLPKVLFEMPKDKLVLGNVDPSSQFRNGTPESIREATLSLMEKCCGHPNFVISSGCDIPPLSRWENIEAFFAAVAEFYNR